jgi:ribokinase
MTTVVCIGDLMVDVLARLPGSLAPGSDTPAAIGILGGGAAANVAAWLAAAGARAVFVGRAGTDAFGRAAVEDLVAAGVDARVEFDPHRPTGTCIVLVDPDGERTMIPSAGANAAGVALTALPEQADWLYLSGYAVLGEASRPSAQAALDLARRRGWSIAVDAASAAPLARAGADRFVDWVGPEVLLFANTDEARVLTGVADPTAAARALGRRCGAAVVKRGAAGAVWSDGGQACAVPAVAATLVDTTGAGDAFAAGYLAGAGDPADRLRGGAELAARAVAVVGGRPGSISG